MASLAGIAAAAETDPPRYDASGCLITSEDEADEEDDEGGLGRLFLNEEYDAIEFNFGEVAIRGVLASQASSTDYDLTGQIVWPVSVFLSWYIASNPLLFRGRTVVELGAGCGLASLVAARVGAATTWMTDGSEVVMRLLERQIEAAAAQAEAGSELLAERLVWGSQASLDAFWQRCRGVRGGGDGNDDDGGGGGGGGGGAGRENVPAGSPFGETELVIIGADVVCWPNFVRPFLDTVKALLLSARAPFETSMYIGYVCRATQTRDQFFAEAAEMGLLLETVEPATFLPEVHRESPFNANGTPMRNPTWPDNVQSNYDLELYQLRLDPSSRSALVAPKLGVQEEISAPY